MVTYHGSTVKLKIERLTAEGKIDKEYLGVLDGSAADQDFYTKNFPITTGAGVTTEAEVDMFTDDGSPGSGSEYLDDSTDFEIDGSEGKVTIKAAENQGGNAGERISINYYTTANVGRGQSVKIDYDGGLIDIHELGERDPRASHNPILILET